MNILLDTCTFLWLSSKPKKLSDKALSLCANPQNTLYLSPVSAWEIILKHRIGKLSLKLSPDDYIKTQRLVHDIEELAFEEADAFHQVGIDLHHKDPFDRMLVCQAIEHDLTLLTPDEKIQVYDVKTEW